MKTYGSIWKIFFPFLFVIYSILFVTCFSPLQPFDNNQVKVTVNLGGNGGSGRAAYFSEDADNTSIESSLVYAVKFTNVSTRQVIAATVTKNGDTINAAVVISPGTWRIDGTADLPGTPPTAYAIGTVTENIQEHNHYHPHEKGCEGRLSY